MEEEEGEEKEVEVEDLIEKTQPGVSYFALDRVN